MPRGRWNGYPPWPERLTRRIAETESGCWLLTPIGKEPTVRQTVLNEHGRQEAAKGAIWRFYKGTLGPGLQLYGGCGTLFCVNPEHLIPLDRREIQRITVWRQLGRDPEFVCGRGHLRAEHGYRSPLGKLRCRTCETVMRREHRAANPEMEQITDRARKRRMAGWPTLE